MGRTGRQISRALIALFVVVGAIGGIVYLNNKPASRAKLTQPAIAAAAPVLGTPAMGTPATGTPTTAPSTQPDLAPPLHAQQEVPTGTSPAGNPQNTQQTSAPGSSPAPAELIASGLAKKESGDLLAARAMLNDAIQSNSLSDADLARCRAALGEINDVLIFSTQRFADDEYGGTYTVQSGQVLQKIADSHDVTWELLCRINKLSDPKKLRAAATIKVIKGPFHAVVTKHSFMMDIYVGAPPGERGSMYVMSFPVGLGTDNSTPTGVWLVEPHKKLKEPTYYSPRGEGVIPAGDPKNPLGHRWIGLTGIDGHAIGKLSYGVHGTIEPDSIGKQSSMGCIRMRNEDVERVYELLIEGKSQVVVKD